MTGGVQAGAVPNSHVSILGAGIIGASCALYLRRAGVPFTMFDPAGPGERCSAGNAGMLGVDSCVPAALPGIAARVPAMLCSSDGPLGLDPGLVIRSLPWVYRMLRASSPARVTELSSSLRRLQSHLQQCYDELLTAAGAHHLVSRVGKIHICETEAAFRESQYARDLQRRHGVEMHQLAPAEVAQLEPALTRKIHAGIHYPNVFHSVDPRRMVQAFARAALDGQSCIVRDRIVGVRIGPDGPTELIGEAGRYPARRIVLAAGIDSGVLARRLGARVPMIAQRGYNVTIANHGLRMPVKSEDRKVILTPMAAGIRVTGIAELARPEKPPVTRFHDRIARHARNLLHDPPGPDYAEPWMGSRPCTPDSLPVIGRSSRYPNVVFAYGHGHLGLGLGPVTGRLVCDLVTGAAPLVPLDDYSPDRFARRPSRVTPA